MFAFMREMDYDSFASIGFERSNLAKMDRRDQPESIGILCSKAKVVYPIPPKEQFNRMPFNSGFLLSIEAASDAIDNLLTSARCTGKIGKRETRPRSLEAVTRPTSQDGGSWGGTPNRNRIELVAMLNIVLCEIVLWGNYYSTLGESLTLI